MSKRHEEFQYAVPKKRGRFAVLADYDDGHPTNEEAATSDKLNAEERVERTIQNNGLRGKKPSIHINKNKLSMFEFARMCHSFVTKNEIRRPAWLMFNKFKLPGQLVILRIKCTEEQLNDENQELHILKDFFKQRWTPVDEEAANCKIFWDNLLHITVSRRAQLKMHFQQQNDPLKELHTDGVVKLALLTTTEDMANLNYPIHGFEDDDIPGVAPVVATKQRYAKVTKDSPIFVLDCEMCITDAGISELTRVTLINELGETLLDTFVKPFNKITDYVTCFSGVTEESLKGVSVRVVHVQEAFQRILPPDAILCGHSIENDLKALRLSHPYCIDVGFAYNMVNKKVRTSLRGLVYYYFNEKIQTSSSGHCSYEDAWAALRLLKLKLENGIQFGSIALGFNYPEWAKTQKFNDNAQLFSISTAKDFAKEPYREVTLPEPRQVGQCLTCSTPISSQCYIEKCPCSNHFAKYCCICVAKDAEPATVEESELFNFGKALAELKTICYRPTLREHLAGYKKPSKVMVARYLNDGETASELTDKNIHTFDMTPFTSIAEIEAKVLDEKIMSHDLCLLEWNAAERTMSELDGFMRAVQGRVANHGIFGTLLCSPAKSILYLNVNVK